MAKKATCRGSVRQYRGTEQLRMRLLDLRSRKTRRYQAVPEGARRCQTVPEGARWCQRVPEGPDWDVRGPSIGKASQLIVVKVSIAGVEVDALVDTGATTSCCRWDGTRSGSPTWDP